MTERMFVTDKTKGRWDCPRCGKPIAYEPPRIGRKTAFVIRCLTCWVKIFIPPFTRWVD